MYKADKNFTALTHDGMLAIQKELYLNGYELYDESFNCRYYINSDLQTAIIYLKYKEYET